MRRPNRFQPSDRTVDATGTVGRVRFHQEDSCQPPGCNPDANRGRGKCKAAGGPSLTEITTLLDRWAADPLSARSLVCVVTYNVAIGNADANGKNLSPMHPVPGLVSQAPSLTRSDGHVAEASCAHILASTKLLETSISRARVTVCVRPGWR